MKKAKVLKKLPDARELEERKVIHIYKIGSGIIADRNELGLGFFYKTRTGNIVYLSAPFGSINRIGNNQELPCLEIREKRREKIVFTAEDTHLETYREGQEMLTAAGL